MEYMRMRPHETVAAIEADGTGWLLVVERYRRAVLVREAVRGLAGGLVTGTNLVALAGLLGREWAVMVAVVVGLGWLMGAVMLVRVVRRGGPVRVVEVLPSRWSPLPAEAEAEAMVWALLGQEAREAPTGGGHAALWAQRAEVESRVDRLIAETLVRIPAQAGAGDE